MAEQRPHAASGKTAAAQADSASLPGRDQSAADATDAAHNADLPDETDQRRSVEIARINHPVFIFSYIANLTLVTANAATFIFADWVAWLAQHGDTGIRYQEEMPGRIIQYGILAAITARIFLGQSIDRFGVRRVWLTMCLFSFSGMCIFASLREISAWLFVGRILFATGLGGMFTCGTFHIQSCVAEHRRTEFLALLGSSGFVGMILGPQMADFLRWFSEGNVDVFFPRVFTVAAVLLGTVGICILLVTRGLQRPEKHATRPSLLRLTYKYWPGLIVGVAMAMGLVFTIPSLFLVRFNQHENFGGISTYWTTYALVAFTFRLRTAALSQQVGRFRLIFFGLIAQGLGLWALIPVSAWWQLLVSALLCGFGHALLFPSIVSLGTQPFPQRYRGSGTNLTLGCFDLGAGLSAPLLGRIIDLPQFDGVGFRQMFFAAGCIPLTMATIWFFVKRGQTDTEKAAENSARN